MDYNKTLSFISKDYEENVIKSLSSFIKIENISPSYDLIFFSNGKTEKAAEYILSRIKNEKIKNIKSEIIKEDTINIDSNSSNFKFNK